MTVRQISDGLSEVRTSCHSHHRIRLHATLYSLTHLPIYGRRLYAIVHKRASSVYDVVRKSCRLLLSLSSIRVGNVTWIGTCSLIYVLCLIRLDCSMCVCNHDRTGFEQGHAHYFFHWGGQERMPRAGVGFFGRGQQPLPHQLGSLGSAVSSLSGIRDGALTAQRFSTIFSTQDGLS